MNKMDKYLHSNYKNECTMESVIKNFSLCECVRISTLIVNIFQFYIIYQFLCHSENTNIYVEENVSIKSLDIDQLHSTKTNKQNLKAS